MPRGPETLLLLRVKLLPSCNLPIHQNNNTNYTIPPDGLTGLVEVYSPIRNAHLVVFDQEYVHSNNNNNNSTSPPTTTTTTNNNDDDTDNNDDDDDDDDLTLISVATIDEKRGEEYLVYQSSKINTGFGGSCIIKTSKAGRSVCCWWGAWIIDLDAKIQIGDIIVLDNEPLICLCRRNEQADIPPPPTPDLDSTESKVISCDQCGEWFHSECIARFSLPVVVKTLALTSSSTTHNDGNNNNNDTYVCPLCTGEINLGLNVTTASVTPPLLLPRLELNDIHFLERSKALNSQAPNQKLWSSHHQVEWQWWTHYQFYHHHQQQQHNRKQHGKKSSTNVSSSGSKTSSSNNNCGGGEWVLALATLRRFPLFLDANGIAQSPRHYRRSSNNNSNNSSPRLKDQIMRMVNDSPTPSSPIKTTTTATQSSIINNDIIMKIPTTPPSLMSSIGQTIITLPTTTTTTTTTPPKMDGEEKELQFNTSNNNPILPSNQYWLSHLLTSTYSSTKIEKKGPSADLKSFRKQYLAQKKASERKKSTTVLMKAKCSRVMTIDAHKNFIEAQRKEAQKLLTHRHHDGWLSLLSSSSSVAAIPATSMNEWQMLSTSQTSSSSSSWHNNENSAKIREQRLAARRIGNTVGGGNSSSGGGSGSGSAGDHITSLGEDEKTSLTLGRQRSLRFDRSPIHAWGVYADEPIAKDDFIVEYKGELISEQVCQKRDKIYQARGLADYMFRIDANLICDATEKGSIARFINHSCDPNCYTQILPFWGQKKIGIYALRDIAVGEELSYDYKFPVEPDKEKIICRCGAKKCRGVLN
jgi:hypothetical protein